MEEWKEYKLGDLCTITRGASPRPIQNFLSDKGMPWVKIADATASDSRYINSTSQCIVSSGVDKSRKVYVGDLIVSNSATPGLPKFMAIDACVHDGWLIIRDVKLTNKEYLYYSFIDIRRELTNQANGSVFMNLKTDIVRNFTINLPPLEKQNKIVGILSSLDDKIEVNRRINEQLEELAQALFKSWFVDFEPFKDGEFVESELGMIPKGWKVGELQELVHIKRGGSPRPIQNFMAETGYNWLKISDATSTSSPFIYEIKECIKEEGLSKTVFLKAGNLVLSNSATPGIPKFLGIDSCIHDGWLYFPKSNLSNEFLYLLFKYKRNYLISQGNGSVFTNLKTDIVKMMQLAIPNDSIISSFDIVIKSIFENIKKNQQEITHLTNLRDTLLPKLMSGEIDVNEVEI